MTAFLKRTSLAIIMTGALAFGMSAPAFADDCADMIAAVTDAQAGAELNDEDNATVSAALASAIEKQSNGDADGCTADLAQAASILGLE